MGISREMRSYEKGNLCKEVTGQYKMPFESYDIEIDHFENLDWFPVMLLRKVSSIRRSERNLCSDFLIF